MVLTVGPGHTLRQAARADGRAHASAPRSCIDPEGRARASSPSATSCSRSAAGQDPDAERVADHLTADLVFAAPDWSLEQAAVRDGPRRLPPPHRDRGRRGRGRALDARRRALLDRRRRDLRGAARRRRSPTASSRRSPALSGAAVLERELVEVAPRTSRIQRTSVTTNRITPTTLTIQNVVMPTIASVMPTALSSGIRLGPGRWISSPAGGASCLVRAHQAV